MMQATIQLRYRTTALIACTLLLSLSVRGQNRLGVLDSEVDRLFSTWDKPDSPGCALAVIKDGRIIYKKGYGMADLDHDIPIAPDSVFHVASVSKQFTAMAVMLLVKQGKISLDDEVRKLIPQVPDFGAPLTIRQLLNHTGGLRDQWSLLVMSGYRWWEEVIKDEDVFDLISRMRSLNFKPGDQFLYVNTGYTLAARIVEKVSGQSLREFCDLNIFRPLGMSSTVFRDNHAGIVKRQAYGYRQGPDNRFYLSTPNFDTNGPSNLLTTVEDLARWDLNFYNRQVGGDGVIEQMQGPSKLNDGEISNYGLGLRLSVYRGLRAVEHSGGDAGFRAHMIRFPDQSFSVACLCNIGIDASLQARRVADIHLAEHMVPVVTRPVPIDVIALSEQEKAAKLGGYWNSRTEDLARVTLKDGNLFVNMTGLFGAPSYVGQLRAQGSERFRLAEQSGEITFEAMTSDHPQRLIIKPEGARAMIFDAQPPPSNNLGEYTGIYYSEEIDTTYRIILDAGTLFIKRKKYPPTGLQPVFRDGFTTSSILGHLRFTRVRNGAAVDGFTLSAGRIRGFRFVRQRE